MDATDQAPGRDSDAPTEQAREQALLALIRQRIHDDGGALSFDQFMELALYAPGLGYYVAGLPKFGAAGDFVTAPEVSPLFGRCLAAACQEALANIGGGDLLEFGAGSGALAAELLNTLSRSDGPPGRYLILEPSPDLQQRQRELISARAPAQYPRVQWLSSLPSSFRGVVIANEVLDAMPVQRFRIGPSGVPEEVFVSFDAARQALVETSTVVRSPGLRESVLELQAQGLARDPGYCSEINLRLRPWMAAVAEAMELGLVLIIDYGYPRHEYYHPQRRDGTLIGHYRHQTSQDPFAHLGRQDLSAHVDFSALADAASAAGFRLAGYTTQTHFLLGCGFDTLMAEALAAADDPGEALTLSTAARQLVWPTAMGERFQVMGLARHYPHDCRGFSLRDLRKRL